MLAFAKALQKVFFRVERSTPFFLSQRRSLLV